MTRIHGDVSSSFKDEDGHLVEYFRGDQVKPEHEDLLDGWDALVPAGEEHLTPGERLDRALNPDIVEAQEPAAEPEAPAAGGEPITGDYESHKPADLQAEADRRGLTVEGTGQGGNVLKADLVTALQADDAA